MISGSKYIALFSIILFGFHTEPFAQQISSAVMNVSVEVVSGSSVEINNREWFTFQNNSSEAAPYAMLTIHHEVEGIVLTTSSDSVTLINGIDQFEMKTEMTQNRNESGEIELHFSGMKSDNIKNGRYSGKQIAEIIYL